MESGRLELFINDDEVFYQDAEGMHALKPYAPIVNDIFERVEEFYPKAYEALKGLYAESEAYPPIFRYKVVRRFCKCNFGVLDHTKEDIEDRVFYLERVPCPLRGECGYQGIICMPEVNTKLSEGEKRVMRLVCEGKGNYEIAEELCISPNTVKRHISTSYTKTQTRNRAEFCKYASDNNIFN